jgi:hypothetical protein
VGHRGDAGKPMISITYSNFCLVLQTTGMPKSPSPTLCRAISPLRSPPHPPYPRRGYERKPDPLGKIDIPQTGLIAQRSPLEYGDGITGTILSVRTLDDYAQPDAGIDEDNREVGRRSDD